MILHFDFSTGASGDKIFGALLEACEQLDLATFAQVERLATALLANVRLDRGRKDSGGITATTFAVSEDGGEHGHHRHWADIREIIELAVRSGDLSAGTGELALSAFAAVAHAEATVHGVEPEKVHFHEVGAADSIIDIVCCSYLLDKINPIAVYATPLALGSGTVLCAHGELPVPAPATAILVQGLPVYASANTGELTTPTGATLARTFVTDFAPLPPCVPAAVGYGAGSRAIPDSANVVRLLVAESLQQTTPALRALPRGSQKSCSPGCDGKPEYYVEQCVLLESNIDHLSAEVLAFAAEELIARPEVLDVWQEPITMKKGRLATRLSVLAKPADAEQIAQVIIELTHSLGVRRRLIERTVVERSIVELDTPYGPVPFKAAAPDDPASRAHWLRPEHDAVARIARERDLDYNNLYEELLRCYNSQEAVPATGNDGVRREVFEAVV